MENNRIIAEFMGVIPRLESPDVYTYADTPYFSIREDNPEKVMEGIVGYVKYHKSWDWLIPVIKKIREIINTELSIDEFDLNRNLAQRLNPYDYSIESIHKGVVEFIKWYNHLIINKKTIHHEN